MIPPPASAASRPAIEGFITARMALKPVPFVPEVRLHTAEGRTRLSQLAELDAEAAEAPPYWAYPWAGGAVLARHILDRPEAVAGRSVLDLGAGSGLVGIAAALAGARAVLAADIDRNAMTAMRLNAEANGVTLVPVQADLLDGPPPEVEIVLVGDLFYDPALAERSTAFLSRCVAAGLAVLVGDPGRAGLPHARLRVVAQYRVDDVGDVPGGPGRMSSVFAFA